MSTIVTGSRQSWGPAAYLNDNLRSQSGPAQRESPKPCRHAHYGTIMGDVQFKRVLQFSESIHELRVSENTTPSVSRVTPTHSESGETSVASKFTEGELIVLSGIFCPMPEITVGRFNISTTCKETPNDTYSDSTRHSKPVFSLRMTTLSSNFFLHTWLWSAQCGYPMQRCRLANLISGADPYRMLASLFHVRGPHYLRAPIFAPTSA